MQKPIAGLLAVSLIAGSGAAARGDGRHADRSEIERARIVAETRRDGRDLFRPPIAAVLIYLSIMSVGSPPVLQLPD